MPGGHSWIFQNCHKGNLTVTVLLKMAITYSGLTICTSCKVFIALKKHLLHSTTCNYSCPYSYSYYKPLFTYNNYSGNNFVCIRHNCSSNTCKQNEYRKERNNNNSNHKTTKNHNDFCLCGRLCGLLVYVDSKLLLRRKYGKIFRQSGNAFSKAKTC